MKQHTSNSGARHLLARVLNLLHQWLTGSVIYNETDKHRWDSELAAEKHRRSAIEMRIAQQISIATAALKGENAQLKATLQACEQRAVQLTDDVQHASMNLELTRAQLNLLSEDSSQERQRLLDTLNWLSGTIAHDLRAPIRAIDAYTFFLADDLGEDSPPEAHKTLSEIRRNGQRMAILVDGLLDYMRITVTPMALSSVDMEALLREVIDELPTLVPITICDPLPVITADRQMIKRALHCLLDNAIKFSKPVSHPTIEIKFNAQSSLFEIRDNGVGFDQTHRNKLFKLFHRLHGNDEFDGEGIGLCIAQRIIERHHGMISLERIGRHTIAVFSLGLGTSASTVPASSAAA